MPLAITIAHDLIKLATKLRQTGEFKYAMPDMKSQVTLEYTKGEKTKINTILMSIQHTENYNEEEFKNYIINNIMKKIAKKYNIKYEIFPMEGSAVDYSVAHSSALFFFNKDGKLIDRITNLTVDNIAASIKKVMDIK